MRFLNAAGVTTPEVDRPDRSDRRRRGKSDAVDAEMAARAVISGRRLSTPKNKNGRVEALRVLRWCADAGRPTRFKPSSPSPTDAVRDGSAKLGHPVQNVTREHGLTPLPR